MRRLSPCVLIRLARVVPVNYQWFAELKRCDRVATDGAITQEGDRTASPLAL